MALKINYDVLNVNQMEEKIKGKINADKLRSNLLSAIAYWEKQVKFAKNIGE